METTGEDEEITLKVNQGIHKPCEKRSMISTFQDHFSGTRLDNTPVQHTSSSIFGLVFHNKYTYDTFVNLQIHGVDE